MFKFVFLFSAVNINLPCSFTIAKDFLLVCSRGFAVQCIKDGYALHGNKDGWVRCFDLFVLAILYQF